ncbi:tryptophan synthase, alpha chain [Pacificibacter marinus]|nr:tryptophan synthase, alpha chain [Pacificibacter marinus]
MSFVVVVDSAGHVALGLVDFLFSGGVGFLALGILLSAFVGVGLWLPLAGCRSLHSWLRLPLLFFVVGEFVPVVERSCVVILGYYCWVSFWGFVSFFSYFPVGCVVGFFVVDLFRFADVELWFCAVSGVLNFLRLALLRPFATLLAYVLAIPCGFVCWVSVAGVSVVVGVSCDIVVFEVGRVLWAAGLPVVVGFGVIARGGVGVVVSVAGGFVVGSAIVAVIGLGLSVVDLGVFVMWLAVCSDIGFVGLLLGFLCVLRRVFVVAQFFVGFGFPCLLLHIALPLRWICCGVFVALLVVLCGFWVFATSRLFALFVGLAVLFDRCGV